MSEREKIPWQEAADVARACVDELRPVVVRAKTAGSIRRRAPLVGDVEIVVEAPTLSAGLFGDPEPDIDPIRAVARRWGTILKGGERMIQIERPDGLRIDLYIVHPPAQWGVILAIRTGPAELGHHAVKIMQARGYRCESGALVNLRTGEILETPDECSFFAAAGLPCLSPASRHAPAAFRQVNR